MRSERIGIGNRWRLLRVLPESAVASAVSLSFVFLLTVFGETENEAF